VCRDKVASATGCRGTEPGIRVGACVPDRDWSRVGIGESTRARARRARHARAFVRVRARWREIASRAIGFARARALGARASGAHARDSRSRDGGARDVARANARAHSTRARERESHRGARARVRAVFFLETFSRASLSRTVFATAIAHRETREECARRIARIARRALVVARSRMHSRAVRASSRARASTRDTNATARASTLENLSRDHSHAHVRATARARDDDDDEAQHQRHLSRASSSQTLFRQGLGARIQTVTFDIHDVARRAHA